MATELERLEEMADLISIALTRECGSVKFYRHAYDRAATDEVRKMFALFIEQEKTHESILRAEAHKIRMEIESKKKPI